MVSEKHYFHTLDFAWVDGSYDVCVPLVNAYVTDEPAEEYWIQTRTLHLHLRSGLFHGVALSVLCTVVGFLAMVALHGRKTRYKAVVPPFVSSQPDGDAPVFDPR